MKFCVIIVLTKRSQLGMAIITVFLRGLIFWVFATAAVEKALQSQQFRRNLLRIIPLNARIITLLQGIIVVTEIAICIGLAMPQVWTYSAAFASALLALFAIALGIWTTSGLNGECGCGGLLPTKYISWTHIAIVSVLAGAAAILAVSGILGVAKVSHGSVPLSGLLFVLPLPLLLVLSTVSEVLSVRHQIRAIDARITGIAANSG